MEIYTTKDNTVSKYIHDDGSETAIKTVASCNNIYNSLTKKYEQLEDRNKYVVFISSSVGCKVTCKFCYLTAKKFPYYSIEVSEIIKNVKEAIQHKIETNPELKQKYIKLSFMGMGDAFYILDSLPYISKEIMDWVTDNKLAKGIDGIDIGTTFPNYNTPMVRDNLFYNIYRLVDVFQLYETNPLAPINTKGVRILYSLHSFNDQVRRFLIPSQHKVDVLDVVQFLKHFCTSIGIELIFHQMFISGINDANYRIMGFIDSYKTHCNDFELRILQFNECKNSSFLKPSKDRYEKILIDLNENIKFIKIQHSAGSEIKASCGQFLMSKLMGVG